MSAKGSALNRRKFLSVAGATGAVAALPVIPGCSTAKKARVIIVGGGFGGATCAKYISLADPDIEVTLIECNPSFVTCPFSNSVIGGFKKMPDITHSYEGLRDRGIKVLIGRVTGIDSAARNVTLSSGDRLSYDRLVLSPGVDMVWNAIENYDEAAAQIMPHAWKAGPQTILLRNQLEAMEDGGVVVISAPEYPYRCPPAPYERASLIAHYLMRHKPRSKIIILDAKDKYTKQPLFEEGWRRLYPQGMIEWVAGGKGGRVTRVEPQSKGFFTDSLAIKADVGNVVPPQQAAAIAHLAGVADDGEWCRIDPYTFQSKSVEYIHVLGDACVAGAMPKSGFSANNQGKVTANALVALLNGREVGEPFFLNTCYSLLSPDYGISINAAYRATPAGIVALLGSGATSPLDEPDSVRREAAKYTGGWYASITGEMFSKE